MINKIFVTIIILSLSACASKPPPPKPEPAKVVVKPKPKKIVPPKIVVPESKKVSLTFIPSTDLNKMGKKSYPLKVTIYQLKSAYNFEGHDFRAITDNEKQALQDDVVHKEDLRFKPGESPRNYTIDNIDSKVKYIGFIAYYMDIKRAKWQGIYKLPKQNQSKTSVYLTDKKIMIK